MKKRFNQLKSLSANEWHVMLTSLWLLPLIALALHLKGFKWTQTFLQRRLSDHTTLSEAQDSSANNQSELATARSVARMVAVTANYGPYRANCLKKALATWWLLARGGVESEFRVGVNKDNGEFCAHAWVEYKNNVLIDSADIRMRFLIIDLPSTRKG